MKQKTITVYSYEELNDKAQKRVQQWYNEHWMDENWHDFTLMEWKEQKLPELGFDDAEIQYSGFWSQGDGASFTAQVDLVKWLTAHKLGNKYRLLLNRAKEGEVDARIERASYPNYVHSNMIDAEIDAGNYETGDSEEVTAQLEKEAGEVEALLTEHARELSDEIYSELQQEYEYQTSEEVMKETLEANELDFDEYGRLI